MGIPVDIRPASFRGIAFEAVEVSHSVGRRLAEREIPDRDEPDTDDMGRKARHWELQAFIVGPNAGKEAADLEAACETAGPGVLVHPTKGTFSARCENCAAIRRTDGVNCVEFALIFYEAGSVFQPIPVASDTTTALGLALRAAVSTYYETVYRVDAVARKVQRLAKGNLEERAVALLGLVGTAVGTDVADYIEAVNVAGDMFEAGERTAGTIADAFDGVLATLTDEEDARKVAEWLGDKVDESQAALTTGADTDTDTLVLSNAAATDLLQYAQALSYASELSAAYAWTSYDEAAAVLSDLSERLDDLGLVLDDSAAYAAAVDLRAALTDSIQEQSGELPRLRTETVASPKVLLLIAYDLYEDASRATEILDRNAVSDPGAVSGDLLVLDQ